MSKLGPIHRSLDTGQEHIYLGGRGIIQPTIDPKRCKEKKKTEDGLRRKRKKISMKPPMSLGAGWVCNHTSILLHTCIEYRCVSHAVGRWGLGTEQDAGSARLEPSGERTACRHRRAVGFPNSLPPCTLLCSQLH